MIFKKLLKLCFYFLLINYNKTYIFISLLFSSLFLNSILINLWKHIILKYGSFEYILNKFKLKLFFQFHIHIIITQQFITIIFTNFLIIYPIINNKLFHFFIHNIFLFFIIINKLIYHIILFTKLK